MTNKLVNEIASASQSDQLAGRLASLAELR